MLDINEEIKKRKAMRLTLGKIKIKIICQQRLPATKLKTMLMNSTIISGIRKSYS